MNCPECHSYKFVKNGHTYYGKQRFRCKECGRQFVNNSSHPRQRSSQPICKFIDQGSFVNVKSNKGGSWLAIDSTNNMEKYMLRQRVSKLFRKILSFYNKNKNIIRAIWEFSPDYNASLQKSSLLSTTSTKKQYQLSDITLIINSFLTPKSNLKQIESEDKIDFSFLNEDKLRIALADGATESIYSGVWAEKIVKKYLSTGGDLLNRENLEDLQGQFLTHAYQSIEESPETRQWFLYEKLERGTGATLIALEFSNSRTIDILSVGDSCVFWKQNNDSGKIEMFPQLSVQDFGNSPSSICHLSQTWKKLNQSMKQKSFSYTNQLQALICSDAFACWLIRELENNPSIWDDLFKFQEEQSNFQEFIRDLRNQKKIRNDDVSVVTINAVPI